MDDDAAEFGRDRYPAINRELDDDEDEEDDVVEDNDDEVIDADGDDSGADSSPDSRGKRRRIDRYALGFELAPRLNPATAAPVSGNSGGRGAAVPPAPDWTEEATFALLDAWGERFIRNGCRSLKSEEWTEVARIVSRTASSSPGAARYSEAQCRNRIDTMKRKYRKDKAKVINRVVSGPRGSGKWIYYDKMDSLMSPSVPMSVPSQPLLAAPRQRTLLPPQQIVRNSWALDGGRDRDSVGSDSEPESLDDGGEEESDGGNDGFVGLPAASYRMLTNSIDRFIDTYQRVESSRQKHMVAVEKMHMDFQRDMEVQRQQILERARAEIASMTDDEGEDDEVDDDGEEESENDDDNGDRHSRMGASP